MRGWTAISLLQRAAGISLCSHNSNQHSSDYAIANSIYAGLFDALNLSIPNAAAMPLANSAKALGSGTGDAST